MLSMCFDLFYLSSTVLIVFRLREPVSYRKKKKDMKNSTTYNQINSLKKTISGSLTE